MRTVGAASQTACVDAAMAAGTILFVPAATPVTITATEPLTIWGAACNGTFFTLHGALEGAADPAASRAAVDVAAAVGTSAFAGV